jgi:hypothetical protein
MERFRKSARRPHTVLKARRSPHFGSTIGGAKPNKAQLVILGS